MKLPVILLVLICLATRVCAQALPAPSPAPADAGALIGELNDPAARARLTAQLQLLAKADAAANAPPVAAPVRNARIQDVRVP